MVARVLFIAIAIGPHIEGLRGYKRLRTNSTSKAKYRHPTKDERDYTWRTNSQRKKDLRTAKVSSAHKYKLLYVTCTEVQTTNKT